MKATIYDVSKVSGVSTATISRAFSNPNKVRSETRKKVYEAAELLHYYPNAIARAMSLQRTDNIAFLICKKGANILDEFYARICDAVMAKTNQTAGKLLISTADDWQNGYISQQRKQIEGAILAGNAPMDLIGDLREMNVSIVIVNNRLEGADVPSILSDEEGGMRDLIAFLIGKGHTRIGMIAGRFSPFIAGGRYNAFMTEMKRKGLRVENENIAMCDPNIVSAAAAAETILRGENRPTALIGANDVIAAGIYKAAKKCGLSIPEDLAVAGIDDSSICSILDPELTSVHIDCTRMGELAVDNLCDLLGGKKKKEHNIVVPEELHVRGSV